MHKLHTLILCVSMISSGIAGGLNWVKSHFETNRHFINNRYLPAVSMLWVNTPVGGQVECTATAFAEVDDGYLFMSAGHCVADAPQAEYYVADKWAYSPHYMAKLLAYSDPNTNLDFSVFHVTAPKGAFTVVPLGHNPQQVGERIEAISAPAGIGKAYMEGTISMLDLPEQNNWHSWTHNIVFEMLGEGPGSSGSTIICMDQMKVCAEVIGHTPGGMVAIPIERFEQWWAGVQAGTVPHFPATKKV